ncbi:MAG: superoxide dismutase [Desulfomonilaceae bacterium]|nr:superoxide dismutase [Desulfomonilaceae bacterium]
MSRREIIAGAGAVAAMGLISGFIGSEARASAPKGAPGTFSHKLPPLPYAYNALEPVIDEETVRIHHDKHFAGYVKGLNDVLVKLEKARRDGNFDSIGCLENDLAFHGSGVVLHWIYFSTIGPNAGGKPTGKTAEFIDRDFGSFDAFWKQFAAASKAVQGSGWGVLAWEPFSKRLVILQAGIHQNLTSWGVMPILVCDVWEHAYYLKYQNRRAEYVDNFAKIVNWKKVDEHLAMYAGQ